VTAIDASWSRDRRIMYAVGESPNNPDDAFPPVVYLITNKNSAGPKKWSKLIHSN